MSASQSPAVSRGAVEPRRSVPTLRDPRYSQSLERCLALLRCVTPARPVTGIAEIATELGMNRSTTHRYAVTLVALGYLQQSNSRKYRLGLRVTDLGMSALNSTGLREHAHPYLQGLRELPSYTASVGVLDGIVIVYADRVRSLPLGQNPLDMQLATGSRVPAYATAIGKLLHAGRPPHEQRERIAEMKLHQRAPNTITSKNAAADGISALLGYGPEGELSNGASPLLLAPGASARSVVCEQALRAQSCDPAVGIGG